MPKRLEKTYDRVLIALKELGYKLDPKVFEVSNEFKFESVSLYNLLKFHLGALRSRTPGPCTFLSALQ